MIHVSNHVTHSCTGILKKHLKKKRILQCLSDEATKSKHLIDLTKMEYCSAQIAIHFLISGIFCYMIVLYMLVC